MKNYIDDIFDRTALSQICSFLLYGAQSFAPQRSYGDWTTAAHDQLMEQLEKSVPDTREQNQLAALVYSYAGAVETLSMELGLKAGARLMLSLLQQDQGA